MAPALQLDAVSKSYGSVRAVQDLYLTVPEGSAYGFLGPNGSGKTTSIRMMMSILIPDQGTIQVQGQPAGAHTQDRIGYLPEERGLYLKMTAGDLLLFFAELKRVPPVEAERRVNYWLDRLDLGAWRERKLNEFSKGMQQKVQFIVSVIGDPPILILDEFSSGLDPVNANLLREVLLELRGQGKTILFSTHRMEEAERLCDHICLINRGRKVLDGRLTDVRAAAGRSTLRIEYRGDAGLLRQAPGVATVDDYGNYAELRLVPAAANAAGAAAVLRALAPKLEITQFALLEPSLNQIFLTTVGADRGDEPTPEAARSAPQGTSA